MKINNFTANVTKASTFPKFTLMDYIREAYVDCAKRDLDKEIETLFQIIDDICNDVGDEIGSEAGNEFKDAATTVKHSVVISDWVNAMWIIFNNMPARDLNAETAPLVEAYLRMVTNIMRKWWSCDVSVVRFASLGEAIAVSLWRTGAKNCCELCAAIDDVIDIDIPNAVNVKNDTIAATIKLCAEMYHYLLDDSFIHREFRYENAPETVRLAKEVVVEHWSALFVVETEGR